MAAEFITGAASPGTVYTATNPEGEWVVAIKGTGTVTHSGITLALAAADLPMALPLDATVTVVGLATHVAIDSTPFRPGSK